LALTANRTVGTELSLAAHHLQKALDYEI